MKKKKFTFPTWLKGALISVIIIPIIAFSWHNIQSIWASPEKIEGIEKKVNKHETSEEKIEKLIIEQQARIDKQETVSALQVEALREQLKLVAELKKK